MNIDSILRCAGKAAAGWSAASAIEVARSLGGRPGARIDWDDGAGEAWVRVLAGRAVVAYVSTAVPLAIIEAQPAGTSAPEPAVQVIVVGKMAEAELSSARDALETAFGHSDRLDLLDRDKFSADDLWYATV